MFGTSNKQKHAHIIEYNEVILKTRKICLLIWSTILNLCQKAKCRKTCTVCYILCKKEGIQICKHVYFKNKTKPSLPGMVVNACNPSYLGSGDWEDLVLSPTGTNS
jgi:hypothetical protein